MDSRTILDSMGAEKLLGRGDMLCTSPELQKPRRVQCAFVSEEEIKKVVAHVIKHVPPLPTPEEIPLNGSASPTAVSLDEYQGDNDEDNDPLYEEAKAVVVDMQKASATLLQRRLKVGYTRARLLDLLELKGVVGKGVGAKPREIMVQANTLGMNAQEISQDEMPPASS